MALGHRYGLFRLSLAGLALLTPAMPAAYAAQPAKPAISQEAGSALLRMGKTLLSKEYSFEVRTIRVYKDSSGRPLHIFHTLDVLVRRPDRLRVTAIGDDGTRKLFYNGKSIALYGAEKNKYAVEAAPETIAAMLRQVMGRLQVNFPLADFLTDAPNKGFLTGAASGREVDTVTIEGAPYRHLFFSQPPGIDLELWVDKSEQALPRRLILTYRSLPGQPSFIAEFAKWDFSVHPSDADFEFTPPEGAAKVALTAPAGAAPARSGSSNR
ncbi:MAG: DUF2092 domain-containing protein [Thiohalocapsa sp.]